jgi:hypothetical protein
MTEELWFDLPQMQEIFALSITSRSVPGYLALLPVSTRATSREVKQLGSARVELHHNCKHAVMEWRVIKHTDNSAFVG